MLENKIEEPEVLGQPIELTYRQKIDRANEEARKLEPEILKKADALFQEFYNEFYHDREDYRVRINRLQNWLQIFIERQDRTFSTALNLDRIDSVRLDKGREPDNLGEVDYQYEWETTPRLDGSRWSHEGAYVLKPQLPKLRIRELFVENIDAVTRINHELAAHSRTLRSLASYPPDPSYQTPNFPRCAQDDWIVFAGIRSVLYVPAGLGERIYNRILQTRDSYGRQRGNRPGS